MRFFDSHSHLHFPQFDTDRDEVLARMKEKQVGSVLIGTDFETSKRGVELAEKHDFLWASVGLHPNDNVEEVFEAEAFEELARHPKVVGIGECGLDFFRSEGTEEGKVVQKERFTKQINLAEKVEKALIIHCRNAHEDMLQILSEKKLQVPVVIHFFTGTAELAQKYLELGCYLSFPGPVTYTDMYDESIRAAPLEKILVETDAPFAAPVPHRGKRNEPVYVLEVLRKVAAIKGLPEEEAQQHILENTRKAFQI